MRLDVAIKVASIMGQDFIIMLLEKEYAKPWDNEDLWIKWHTENEVHMKRYRFFKRQSKTDVGGGVWVASFSDLDVTIIGHILEKLGTNDHQNMFVQVKELRNAGAHATSLKLEGKEFEKIFENIFSLITRMFDGEKKYVDKWTRIYMTIKRGNIQDPEIQEMQKKLDLIALALEKRCEAIEKKVDQLIMSPKTEDKKSDIQILEQFRCTLQDHIKTDLSTIRIPASTTLMDLSEAVLNQSMRLIVNEDDANAMDAEGSMLLEQQEVISEISPTSPPPLPKKEGK